jgi:predicted nucleic acid-binding protein
MTYCFDSSAVVKRYAPVRGYDAVHLATAIVLNNALIGAGQSQLVFVAADTRLCDAAQEEGLATETPNDH